MNICLRYLGARVKRVRAAEGAKHLGADIAVGGDSADSPTLMRKRGSRWGRLCALGRFVVAACTRGEVRHGAHVRSSLNAAWKEIISAGEVPNQAPKQQQQHPVFHILLINAHLGAWTYVSVDIGGAVMVALALPGVKIDPRSE